MKKVTGSISKDALFVLSLKGNKILVEELCKNANFSVSNLRSIVSHRNV